MPLDGGRSCCSTDVSSCGRTGQWLRTGQRQGKRVKRWIDLERFSGGTPLDTLRLVGELQVVVLVSMPWMLVGAVILPLSDYIPIFLLDA